MSLHQNVCGHKIVVCPEAGCNHKVRETVVCEFSWELTGDPSLVQAS